MSKIDVVKVVSLILLVVHSPTVIPCPEDCVCSYYNGRHPMDCSSNGLTDMVSNIPEWTTSIRLDGNELRTLDLTFCHECAFFQEISVRYNEISNLVYSRRNSSQQQYAAAVRSKLSACSHIANTFRRLWSVNLRGNSIRGLPKCFFHIMPKLKYLNLNENRIRNIPQLNLFNQFANTHSLNELHLRRNQLSQLVRKDMYTITIGLQRLRILDLSENRLHTVESGVFTFLDDLEDLNLSGNKIGFLPDFSFVTRSEALQQINLRSNRIDWISVRAFAGLPNLVMLDLRENRIECLYPNKWSTCQYVLPPLFGVPDDSVVDRGLEHFDRRFAMEFSESVQFKLAKNLLRCDCRLKRLVSSCRNHCDIPEMTCYSPAIRRGESLNRVVDNLECNATIDGE